MYKVCIADDEEFVLESVRWRIQQSVIELEIAGVARNGIEAYELYEKVCPDIYFVDINMPLCSGLEFCGESKESGQKQHNKIHYYKRI